MATVHATSPGTADRQSRGHGIANTTNRTANSATPLPANFHHRCVEIRCPRTRSDRVDLPGEQEQEREAEHRSADEQEGDRGGAGDDRRADELRLR